MILSTIANWYGAARNALRAMLFGLPAPASGETSGIPLVSQTQAAELERGMVANRLAKMQQGGDRRSKDFKAQICAVSQDQAAELEQGANQHALIQATSQRQGERTDLAGIQAMSQAEAAEPPEATACQPPESTPGSFNYIRSHQMHVVIAADFAGLQCLDCSMRWPTAPEPANDQA